MTKPFLVEEIDQSGNAFARIVWAEAFDDPEIHLRHGAVLDILPGDMIVNVDDFGSNSADELIERYSGIIDEARAQHEQLNPEIPVVEFPPEEEMPPVEHNGNEE